MNGTFANLSKVKSFSLSWLNAKQRAMPWALGEVLVIVLFIQRQPPDGPAPRDVSVQANAGASLPNQGLGA